MITQDNEPITQIDDGDYVVQHGAYRYLVRDSDENGIYKKAEVESYLAAHPEALVPEPLPPPPSKEQKAAAIRAELAALDAQAIRPLRAILSCMGKELTPEREERKIAEAKKLAELEQKAEELRGML